MERDLYQGAEVSFRSMPFDANCQAFPLLYQRVSVVASGLDVVREDHRYCPEKDTNVSVTISDSLGQTRPGYMNEWQMVTVFLSWNGKEAIT